MKVTEKYHGISSEDMALFNQLLIKIKRFSIKKGKKTKTKKKTRVVDDFYRMGGLILENYVCE